MAFCKFSSEYIAKSYTMIDNVFFSRYLPSTPPKLTAIYLYGLYLCATEDSRGANSSMEAFAQTLGYEVEDIIDAYNYWEEQGLVRIVSTSPFEIQYQPVRGASSANKRFSKDKYASFNIQAQEIITERTITPNEYEEYYTLMEGFSLPDGRKLSPEALLLIIKYCVQNKGANIGYRYIIAVAQNWAREGYVTLAQIEEKLEAYSTQSQEISKINKALGSTKKPGIEEHEFYTKWTQRLGFTIDVIVFVAKSIKKGAGISNFEKLDKKLQKYYEAKLLSQNEIVEFETNKDKLFSLAREVNRTLGLYYEDVSNQVETYISPWLAMGFSAETILAIAQNCYSRAKRTLANLNDEINMLYEQGIVSQNAYQGYQGKIQKTREQIANILKKLNIERNVTSLDIEFWQRWVGTWGLDLEIIDIAVDFAAQRGANLSYVNALLADWHTQGIHTPSSAREALSKFKSEPKQAKPDSKIKKRKYSKEEQSAIFDNFNEIEL